MTNPKVKKRLTDAKTAIRRNRVKVMTTHKNLYLKHNLTVS